MKNYLTEIIEVIFCVTLTKITKGPTDTVSGEEQQLILSREVLRSLKKSKDIEKKSATYPFATQAWAEGQVTLRKLKPLQHIEEERAPSCRMPEG